MRLLYAQMREDPRIDCDALQLNPQDRVFTVTSAGCTTLTLLAEGPREIISVDFNPLQNYLLELKLAAILRLAPQEARRFLGARRGKDRKRIFETFSGTLSQEGRAYWKGRIKDISRGVLQAGTTERLIRILHKIIFLLIHDPARYRGLFRSQSLIRQEEYYRNKWNSLRWRFGIKVAFQSVWFRLVYGARFRERFPSGDFTGAWVHKLDRGLSKFPARTNYFLSQLLAGRYLPGDEGIPPYLSNRLYDRIRDNASRLSWVTSDLTEYLESCPAGRFTKMSLSNAVEWVPPEKIERTFAAISRALAPGGRVVLRHLLGVTPLPGGVSLKEDEAASRDLTANDRSFLYERVSLYERN